MAYALARQHNALRLNLDEWMTHLFRPDRPQQGVMEWYVERAQRCVEQIWRVTESALEAGVTVVLEIGLIQRRDREAFYQRVDLAEVELIVHVVDLPREIRRERVARRNVEQGATFCVVVPPEFFEMASDLWEAPDAEELEQREFRVVGPSS